MGLSNPLILAETAAFYLLAGALFWKGWRSGLLARLPLFYSYLVYMVGTGVALWGVYWADPAAYARAAWARLLAGLLVEFVVLIEVSDHLFIRFPAVRRLGR